MDGTRTILIACDKFKGSLTGRQVNQAVAECAAALGLNSQIFPLADGGDGTLDALEALGFEPVSVQVSGPTGERVSTRYVVKDGIAAVELADSCGILRLPGGVLEPRKSSSTGLGEVLRTALLDPGIREVVVGVGGSASSDGGAGMLFGLGAVLQDADGNVVTPDAAALGRIVKIDLEPVRSLLAGRRIILACDVTNPLLGDQGAVAVFGSQKGLVGTAAAEVEANMNQWADLLSGACGRDLRQSPGAGSAGGVGFAALTALGAQMRRGVDLILELGGFSQRLAAAALVVTGEGSLDEQSLMGKAVAGVCAAVKGAPRPVPAIALCGRNTLTAEQIETLGLAKVFALADIEPDPSESMRRADYLLRQLAHRTLAAWF
ncbi:MAG: glycerate kinase [Propionibacteriaceae bacterium]|nr:glycerate kinase [Propionibacteriaceae bacterium]